MDIGSAYPAPGPASELPRRGRGTPLGVVEGQVEHVVQDERQPLRGVSVSNITFSPPTVAGPHPQGVPSAR